jgi:hypothetical protein
LALPKIDELEIHWPAPSKQIDKFTNLSVNQYVRILENGGIREHGSEKVTKSSCTVEERRFSAA